MKAFPWASGLVDRLGRRLPRTVAIVRETITATLSDGYIHAGNLAYLSIVTLFPLLILFTAITVALGQTDAGAEGIAAVLNALPPEVAKTFSPIVDEVLAARTGRLLWIGGLVALWTVTGFIETLRDIVYRAYGVELKRGFFIYRMHSVLGTLTAMIMLLAAISLHFVLTVPLEMLAEQLPQLPQLGAIASLVDWSYLITPLSIFLSLWALFNILSPSAYRSTASWPGALVCTAVWIGCLLLMGPFVSVFAQMSLTYGALTGVMLALIFFYAVGFSLVFGAELNAALAKMELAA